MITIQKYVRAQSLEEAWQLNQSRSNRILGGMLWLRLGRGSINTAIDLCDLGLDKIEQTDEEFSIIRNHCTNGYELLSAVSQFRGVLQAVRGHHERFDGNGYPDGLKGEEIPEEARIIAVADTFDAMTSNRQYRRSLTFQYACDELNRCKNTQLDAKIVDVFQTLIHDRYFWVRAKDEMGDNLPPHLLLNTVLCAGGEA